MANLVSALSEGGLTVSAAAMLGSVMGVMQLPGRALLMHGGLATTPARLLATSVALHAVGLGAVAIKPSASVVVGGAMVFALGAGLMTLVRPYVVRGASVRYEGAGERSRSSLKVVPPRGTETPRE